MQTTRKYYDRFPHIETMDTPIYAGMVSALDDAVGRVLEKLKVATLSDNTIVIFLSDNVCPNYSGCECYNGLLGGRKRYHHEGGHRIPFFLRWPGQLSAGVVYDKTVSSLWLTAKSSNRLSKS